VLRAPFVPVEQSVRVGFPSCCPVGCDHGASGRAGGPTSSELQGCLKFSTLCAIACNVIEKKHETSAGAARKKPQSAGTLAAPIEQLEFLRRVKVEGRL